MHVQDHAILQHTIKTVSRIIMGVDQGSAVQLYNDLILKNAEQILNDPSSPPETLKE